MADGPVQYDRVTREAMPSTEVTWLHLLRHGEAETGPKRVCRGHLDVGLSERGRVETELLTDFCVDRLPRPTGLICSDLQRTRSLADRLAARWGLPLRVEPALREQSMGAWEGRAWEDINREDPAGVAAYWQDYWTTRPGGGESFGELGARVLAWWATHRAELAGGRWVLVTHTGVIRVFCCSLLGLTLDQALRFAPGYASHTQLAWAEAGGVMTTLGEQPPGVSGRQ